MRRELLAVIHGKKQPSNCAQVISELCKDRAKLKKKKKGGGEFFNIDYKHKDQIHYKIMLYI